jgi:LacI family transcriptional regulator
MRKKITVQDIADQLGLSRNTVSKALNNQRSIAEKTRKIVIQTAVNMGYNKSKVTRPTGQYREIKRTGNVVVVAHEHFVDTSYWSIVSRGMFAALNKVGFNLIFIYLKDDETESLQVPQNITVDNVDGMIILGALRAKYVNELLKVGLPTVYVDAAPDLFDTELMRDTVLMENEASVAKLTRFLIGRGRTKLGFIGDILACRSYYERWRGFCRALEEGGIPLEKDLCVIGRTFHHCRYLEEIQKHLEGLGHLPTAFICANDRIAIYLTKILKEKGIKIPDQVALAGFDDIFEATVIEPNLTTVKIPKEELGQRAAEELIWRFHHPERPVEVIRIGTEVIFRDSTG